MCSRESRTLALEQLGPLCVVESHHKQNPKIEKLTVICLTVSRSPKSLTFIHSHSHFFFFSADDYRFKQIVSELLVMLQNKL